MAQDSAIEKIEEHALPRGVRILAVVTLARGVAEVAPFLYRGRSFLQIESVSDLGFAIGAALTFLIGLLGLAAGLGMWQGKNWGWWTGSFLYVYVVMLALRAMILAPIFNDFDMLVNVDFARLYIRSSAQVILNTLFAVYMFRPNVFESFDLGTTTRKRATGIVIMVAIGLSLVSQTLGLIFAEF